EICHIIATVKKTEFILKKNSIIIQLTQQIIAFDHLNKIK
ncbi:hypothetical protein CP061683_1075, partial [Chlamydia psittaci 06-1683]